MVSSLLTMQRMIGMTIGLSVLTAWGLARFQSLMLAHPFPDWAMLDRTAAEHAALAAYGHQVLGATLVVYNNIFGVCAVVAAVAIVPALFMRYEQPTGEAPSLGP